MSRQLRMQNRNSPWDNIKHILDYTPLRWEESLWIFITVEAGNFKISCIDSFETAQNYLEGITLRLQNPILFHHLS